MTSKFVSLSAGLVVLGVLPAPAIAECSAPGFNPSAVFCDGCKYEGYMTLSHDQPCFRPYTGTGTANTQTLELIDHRLIERAKHGIAGLNANTFAYAPAKGYVGKDEFIVEVLYRQGGKYGKYLVHWNVTVQ